MALAKKSFMIHTFAYIERNDLSVGGMLWEWFEGSKGKWCTLLENAIEF